MFWAIIWVRTKITKLIYSTARRSPFTVGVSFDSNEVTGTNIADAKSIARETSEVPGGITGFQLTYFQVAC